MDVLTEMYVSTDILDKIQKMDENAELRTDSIAILDCELCVKLMSDGSGRWLMKLI